ncbi:g710 [Coccomyxa elongata]
MLSEREYVNLAIGKLATLSEDAAGMKELLEELSPDRADVMTAFAKELGTYHRIVQDQHDVIVDYIRGAETWSGETRLALLDQIRDRSNEVKWQWVRDELEEAGISEEDEERASAWLDNAYMTWNHDGDPDQFIDTVKHYMTFEEALVDDDIEPVVTPDGQADIVYDGVGLRYLSDETWDDVEHLISSEHDFDGAAELCQYVFAQFSELRAALQACGLEYRHDSELCRAYVERGEGDLDRIVGTMREMDFFVKSTEYSAIVSTLRDRRNHYRMTAHAESALAKKVALLSHTGEPPESLRALADDAVALQDANGIYEKIRATEPCSGRWNVCADCRDAYDISDSDESDDPSRDWCE